MKDPGQGKRTVTDWELPPPVDEDRLLRIATVAIPHRGLVPPVGLSRTRSGDVLIPPPPAGHQIEADIFAEPGAVPIDAWPGQTTLDPRLVGRFTLYNATPEQGLLNFALVATMRPESSTSHVMAEVSIVVVDGEPVPDNLRTVVFELHEVDGQQLPLLFEMPVGHMPPEAGDNKYTE